MHLQNTTGAALWQIFAGGRPLSRCPECSWDLPAEPESQPVTLNNPPSVLAHWQTLLADPIAAREEADAYRRFFWQQRRLAGERLPEFLQRVFDW